MTYGPDGFLWITESNGRVSRVDPETGNKILVYTAPDYFAGAESERLQTCNMAGIGNGTLGLALHPDFMTPATSFIYYVYSYNSGTAQNSATKFKIVRLKWDAGAQSASSPTDILYAWRACLY